MEAYKPPKSDLLDSFKEKPPGQVFLVYAIFLFEAVFVFIINLLGTYGLDPTPPFSFEMLVVIAASIFVLFWVWWCSKEGKKELFVVVYIFIGISLVFDGPNWVQYGVLVGFPEFLTIVNFILLLSALYLMKKPLRKWYVR